MQFGNICLEPNYSVTVIGTTSLERNFSLSNIFVKSNLKLTTDIAHKYQGPAFLKTQFKLLKKYMSTIETKYNFLSHIYLKEPVTVVCSSGN